MAKHILLEYSTRRKHAEVPDLPNDVMYDHSAGFWIQHGRPLVETVEFRNSRTSKKCDLETGEDQKGE